MCYRICRYLHRPVAYPGAYATAQLYRLFCARSADLSPGWSWWTAGCFALAIAKRDITANQQRRDRIYGLVVGSLLVLVGAWVLSFLTQHILAVVDGPAYGIGILQESYSSRGLYARIDNITYLIPNPAWLASYQPGQQIQFAYSSTSPAIAAALDDIAVSIPRRMLYQPGTGCVDRDYGRGGVGLSLAMA